MTMFVTIPNVRDYLVVDGTTGKYDDEVIGSNIRTASATLQRLTHRTFVASTGVTRKYSSNGAAIVEITDSRSVSSVLLSGSTRTLDTDAWLVPDPNYPAMFTAIQLRPVGGLDYRSYSDWFDTNKDRAAYWRDGRLPNDLVLVQNEGWDPLPDELLHATKALAAWYTKRPDALLANVQQTEGGAILDYSSMPPEAVDFIATWKRGPVLTVVE